MMSNELLKTRRWGAHFSRCVVFLVILAGINLFCIYCLPAQVDLTRRGSFTLAPQTVNLLAALRSPVEVAVFAPKVPKSAAEHNFRNAAVMFRELIEVCTRVQPLIRFQELDPQESASARQRQEQFPDVTPPCVLITYGSSGQSAHEVLSARDLAEFRAGPDRRLAAVDFLGEQALAGALTRLGTGTKPAILYVAIGHGELALDDSDPASRRGMGILAAQLRELGCELRSLDLTAEARVPFDASLVVLPGGEQTWSPAESDRLGTYLRHGGKALVLVDLNIDSRQGQPVATGLEDLLSEFGVAVGNDRVITQGITGQVAVASPALPAAGEHPLVRALPQSPLTLFECRSLRSSTGLRRLPTKMVPLLVSHPAPRAWAEGDFGSAQPPEPGGPDDSDGPVAMAVAIERRQEGEPQPALVVVGDAEFVANRILAEPAGHVTTSFVFSCVNWLRGRRELLGDIPPQGREGYRLAGTPDEQRGIVWKSSLVLWSLIITAGATVWTTRRRG